MLKRTEPVLAIIFLLVLGFGMAISAQSVEQPKPEKDKAEKEFKFVINGGKRLGIVGEGLDTEQGNQPGNVKSGVKVVEVVKDSAADKAGIQVGDIIVNVDGQPIDSQRALRRKIQQIDFGKPASIQVIRQGAPTQLSFTLEKRPEIYAFACSGDKVKEEVRKALESAKNAKVYSYSPQALGNLYKLGFRRGRLGIQTLELNEQLGEYFGVEKGHGVLITTVVENSPAAKAGLKAGDCIVEINGAPITDVGDIHNQLRKVESGDVRIVLVRNHQRLELHATLEAPEKTSFNFDSDGVEFSNENFDFDQESLKGNFDFDSSKAALFAPKANPSYQIQVVPEIDIPEINIPEISNPDIQTGPGDCFLQDLDFDLNNQF